MGEHKQHSVVVGTNKASAKNRLRLSRKVVIPAVIAVLLIIGIAIGISMSSKDSTAQRPFVAGDVDSDPVSSLSNKVDEALQDSDYTKAKQAITDDKSLRGSRDGKMLTAVIASNEGKFQDAIAIYKEVEQDYGATWNTSQLIAQAYAKAGDKTQAKAYYEKAIAILNKDTKNPTAKSQISDMQEAIKELGA